VVGLCGWDSRTATTCDPLVLIAESISVWIRYLSQQINFFRYTDES
jgi:hypothetical protein